MVFPRLRIGVRCLQMVINVIYLPAILVNYFKKSSKCPPIINRILLIPATELIKKILEKEISCEDVIRAYISRVQEVNPLLNAVIDDRFELSLNEAKEIDEFLAKTELTRAEIIQKYPLLGLPVTVKGSIAVEGLPNTSGMVKRRSVISKQDAVVVKRIKEAGGIPILTSNVPELCLNWETKNKIIGTTNNPYDTNRSVGGSSGGEAALLASGASLLGVGSDIAGSLRLPAHFCGVWGHKPTPTAVSFVGHYPSCTDVEGWSELFTLGPLARYVSDLKLLLETLLEPGFDNKLKLNQKVNLNDVRVFFLEQIDSLIVDPPSQDILSCIRDVVSHFNNNYGGEHHRAQRIDNPLIKYCAELSFTRLAFLDGVDNLFEGKGEGVYTELGRYMIGRSESMMTSILYGAIRRNVHHIDEKTKTCVDAELDDLKTYFEELLGDDGVVIFPAFTRQAHYHGESVKRAFNYSYLSIFNALGLPVTCCPLKLTMDGLPVGVQVVAATNGDRLTLAVAEEIERIFGGWRPPCGHETITQDNTKL